MALDSMEKVMKFLGYDNVLCLSAHPDDAEYGMLGTILKHTDTTFHMVCLSMGGNYDVTTTVNRSIELKNVIRQVDNMELRGGSGGTTVEGQSESSMIHDIEHFPFEFDCVMIAPDIDSHFEHRTINNVGIALARKKKIAVLEYKTPSTLSTWTPNLYVDVAIQLPKKFELLQLFKSQIPNFYFDELSLMAFHIDYQCQKRGMTAVESFRILGAYL